MRVPTLLVLLVLAPPGFAREGSAPYRLEAVDLGQPVLWGAELRLPDGTGLAFGGLDQDAADARPHTRILVDGEWVAIDGRLRERNPDQALHERLWKLRNRVKDTLADARRLYFEGLPEDREKVEWERRIAPALGSVRAELESLRAAAVVTELRATTVPSRSSALTSPGLLTELRGLQIALELAADATSAEPPPRALNCGPKQKDTTSPPSRSLIHEPKTGKFILFGGDHLDYLTNDLWLFDPAIPRWEKQHPRASPPPRANHRLTAPGDGTVHMSGGYAYASNPDYLGGQYIDLDDGEWIYDLATSNWSRADGQEIPPSEPRSYRGGPFQPEHFFGGEKPDAETFAAWLSKIPTNRWIATNPPLRPRLNRDWGTARLDPHRDIILRWSGGHSAHGGTDVPHFHLATNRWELPSAVEFPLGQLYSNTSYPRGVSFNLRPWITGHTYQSYACDPPSRTMVSVGQRDQFHIYDPDKADWIARGDKPDAMSYGNCFYTLTLTATPRGALCWDKNGAVHLFDSTARTWRPFETKGARLPGAYVDSSSIVYDPRRDRVLVVNTTGYQQPYTGRIWALSLQSHEVVELSPGGMEHAHRLATIDKSCYDPVTDLMLFGTILEDHPELHTPTPAYDCAANRWITLDLDYTVGERNGRPARMFPHTRSDALMSDPKRKLIWGLDTDGQVYVLRLDKDTAEPLSGP